MLYVLMAALPAAPGSNLVLATSGGSPDWLLGPLRFAGVSGANGPLAGPLFYAALWATLLLWVVVVHAAPALGVRLALGAVVAMHVAFLLAPPLLSHDVFSYIAYARLGVAHQLNPYTHAPIAIPHDPGFTHAGSVTAVSAYGPLFTLATYPLSPLGVPAALWTLKVVSALASLGIVALVWRIARRLGREPLTAAVAVGLNPLVVVHVVGGAHNEALTVLVTMAGVLLWVGGRDAAGVAVATVATAVKASAGLVVPFLVVGNPAHGTEPVQAHGADAAHGTEPVQAYGADPAQAHGADPAQARGADPRRIGRRVLAAAGAGVAVAAVGIAAFGTHALDAFSLISSNQDRTSRFSMPHRVSELIAEIFGGNRLDYRDGVRTAFALAFAVVFVWLLWRAWRGLTEPLDAIGWATFAILVASAWLVPWYILWLLPFAALSADRRLRFATVALCAWMLAISVPLN